MTNLDVSARDLECPPPAAGTGRGHVQVEGGLTADAHGYRGIRCRDGSLAREVVHGEDVLSRWV